MCRTCDECDSMHIMNKNGRSFSLVYYHSLKNPISHSVLHLLSSTPV